MYAAICISYADCRDFFSEFGRSQNIPAVCKTDFAVAFSSLLICRLKLCLTYEKGSANERREKKVSMTNFHFLSRVQPALIQRQCKREERKESEYDELSFSFPSAACSYPKN